MTTLDLTAGKVTTAQISAALSAIGKTLVGADTALKHYLTTLNTDLGLTFDVPILSSFNTTLAENSTAGTAVGNITIADTGDTNITAITLSGTGAEDFTESTNGAINVANLLNLKLQPQRRGHQCIGLQRFYQCDDYYYRCRRNCSDSPRGDYIGD